MRSLRSAVGLLLSLPLVGLLWTVALVVNLMPHGLAMGLGRTLGMIWARLIPIRRWVAAENLAKAFPEQDARWHRRTVDGMYRHFGMAFVELARQAPWPARRLMARADVSGLEHLSEAMAHDRGVLILTAHLGNFELLARLGVLAERPLNIVTRRMRSPVAQWTWRLLRRGGPRLLVAQGAGRAVLKALRAGQLVGYVLDQHAPSRRAVVAPFFGRAAATCPDLARLSHLSGAPIVPVFTWRQPNGVHRIEIGAALAQCPSDAPDRIEQDTRLLTAHVEAAIRQAPEQWFWIHRRWKIAG